MFNALNGMGGGGQVNGDVSAKANTALYACFAVFGVIAGAIHNMLGSKLLMLIGSLTYVLYAGSYLSYNHTGSSGFSIAAGAILGIGAALLWTAQGAIMMSYPTEDRKGRFISTFWVIFNLGGVIGGIIPLIANFHSTARSVNDGTYIAFIVIMAAASAIPLLMVSPRAMVRDDGTQVVMEKSRGVKEEVMGMLKAFTDWRMLCLLPMFLASNWFYSYQFDGYNAPLFTVRTRGLNNVFYWGAQMAGALGICYYLDSPRFKRSTKAVCSLLAMAVAFCVVWGGGLAQQLQYTAETAKQDIDFTDSSRAAGPIVLYTFYGLLDAILQSWCYWIMGALTNEPSVLARYAGLYKGVQSAGGAISWAIASGKVSLLTQLIINWGLLVVAVVPAYFVARQVEDTSSDKPQQPAADLVQMSDKNFQPPSV
ncbi:major facilitator superfamily domain-containing protein [Syncephalis pseudoplumigaleata]|uniref:Major facilitator superfamily domain-containing protein n=1 Tax=Syncephalis pseudoplumigaleata TaxID=1712513 RepID=A0A4P9Z603_9FUNG|nr:major facilitator superfamily domain-containing protein [Syncephalis pseudoplumigaleata]|eukprot:RKP28067.1 major facilitator superfamily domain-containing protein [Syncephalis pseudoplumigaleata]